MNEGLFSQIFGELFTKEEWDLWVKGEFSLFDNYVERVGISKEDADRLKNKSSHSNKSKLNAKNSYQEFIKNPVKLPNNK